MKLRAYALVNQYIAGIHAGIQTAHALMEATAKYEGKSTVAAQMFKDWYTDHKTLIVLNGGYQQRIYETMELWKRCNFPFAHFCEEDDALNGALTAAVIILPECVYALDTSDLTNDVYVMPDYPFDIVEITQDEMYLARAMKQFKLKGE